MPEVFRSNERISMLRNGPMTKVIRSKKEQIINTKVESKYVTANQITTLRVVSEMEFTTLLTLGTFVEHKGKTPVEQNIPIPIVQPVVPVQPALQTHVTTLPSTTKVDETMLRQGDQFCAKCNSKMIFATDTDAQGKTSPVFICPKGCGEVRPQEIKKSEDKVEEKVGPAVCPLCKQKKRTTDKICAKCKIKGFKPPIEITTAQTNEV